MDGNVQLKGCCESKLQTFSIFFSMKFGLWLTNVCFISLASASVGLQAPFCMRETNPLPAASLTVESRLSEPRSVSGLASLAPVFCEY